MEGLRTTIFAIIDGAAEFRTSHLPNLSQKQYCLSELIGVAYIL
jgi:hypothetical protein